MATMRGVAIVLALTVGVASAAAQSADAGRGSLRPRAHDTGDGWSVQAAYEWHMDRLGYAFDTPSAIDTPFLVPHRYAQTYRLNNQWITTSARYRAAGSAMTTQFGVTPTTTARATDVDTFFNPGDDIVTSGTEGDAEVRSWRLAQWSEGELGGVTLRVGYRYRRDNADFLPADVIVTRSRPPSVSRRFTTDQEFTSSQVHEFVIDSARTFVARGGWSVTGRLAASPLLLGRLSTRLPQKYPGQTIVGQARAAAFSARVEGARTKGRVPLIVAIEWGKSASYGTSRSMSRDVFELSVGLIRAAVSRP